MAKNERKRQKALERHRIKRKQAHTSVRSTGSSLLGKAGWMGG